MNYTGRAVIAAAGIATIVRLVYVVLVAGPNLLSPSGPSDAIDYHAIALNLASGFGFSRDNVDGQEVGDVRLPRFSGPGFDGAKAPTAYRPPLYPAFMASVFLVAGRENFLAVRIAQAILGGITCLLAGWIARSLSQSTPVAVVAALLLAFNPLHLYFTGELLTETLFGCLVLLTLHLMTSRATTASKAALIGLTLGLATLARSTAVALAPIALVSFVFYRRASVDRRSPATLAGAMLLGFGLVVLPWMLRNTLLFDQPTGVSTNGGVNLALGISREWAETIGAPDLALLPSVPDVPHVNEAQWDGALTAAARDRIAANPARFAQLLFRKWRHFFSATLSDQQPLRLRIVAAISFLPILVGTILWPFILWRRRTPDARLSFLLLIAAVLAFSFVHSLFIANVRFRVPIGEPVFAIVAADTWWTVFVAIRERWAHAHAPA